MKKLLLSGWILLVAGCAVGPKYSRPEMENPPAYQQAEVASDSIANLKWWEVFQDTVLQSLIRTSLKDNKDLLTAISRVEQSRAILGYNKANLGPFFDYSVRARATDFRPGAEGATVAFPTNSISVLGNVSWEIDIWGRLRHANAAAFAEMMASEEDRKGIYISLISQVAEQYFTLRGVDERLEFARKTLESRREYLRILTLRFDKGDASELDKLQAEEIAASAEAQVYALERQLVITENVINILLGRPYHAINRGIANDAQQLPSIPQGLPSQLLERRPDIKSSEQQLIAHTERIGMAVAMRFPTLSLTGFLGVASPELSGLNSGDAFLGSVTGQLAGPIFHFGQNKKRVVIQNEIAKQAAYQYELNVISAFAEVESSLARIRTFRNEYQARIVQVRATERSLKLSRSLYDNGYTSFLQVLDAERQYFEASFDKSITLQNELISTVELYKALGGGW